MNRGAIALLPVIAALAGAGGIDAREHGAAAGSAVPGTQASTFVITGRGWGHGIGLSQWGAYGFAQRGAGYEQIVSHYYRGTTLGAAPVSRVRVLLGQGLRTAKIASTGAIRVRDGSGKTHRLEPGSYTLGPGLRLPVEGSPEPKALPGTLLFTGLSAALEYGKPYRGQLSVDVVEGKLRVINHVGLEAYLYGVVPREVPSDWPAEALKAQAVVARSYALAVRKTGAFDLFADVRSQVYGGIPAEKPTTTEAVDATKGQVVLYQGKVATTFFFSTSGGRTASIHDVWESEPVPYLVSVPDPYETASPHHTWGPFPFTPQKLTKTFKVPGGVVDVQTVVNPSQRVENLVLTGAGGQVTVPGADVRRLLGLRSTWFRVGVLRLDAPAAPVEYGTKARLAGIVRGSASVTLEQRALGGAWAEAAKLKPAKDRSIGAVVKPVVSTDYRLVLSPKLAASPVRVRVSPRVRFRQVTERTALRGLVRPVLPGATVAVQRLEGSAWRSVATATLAQDGNFEAQLELVPGSYRARVAPGRGFVPGVSPVLKVLSR